MAKRNGTKLSPATLEELSSLSVHMVMVYNGWRKTWIYL